MYPQSIFYASKQDGEDGIDFFQKLKKYLSASQNFSVFVVTVPLIREPTMSAP